MTAETVLALMMLLLTPGATTNSRTIVAEGARPVVVDGGAYRELEAGEAEPNQCKQAGNVACSRPRYEPRLKAWTRIETRTEALRRWWGIAQSISRATGDRDVLARILVVTGTFEGAWWASVQHGWCHRPFQRSCKYEDGGRAWGLWQVLASRHPEVEIGGTKLRARDLVGAGGTANASRLAARTFSGILKRCHGRVAPCVWIRYGGNVKADDPRIRARVGAWFKVRKAEPRLSDDVREILGLDDAS